MSYEPYRNQKEGGQGGQQGYGSYNPYAQNSSPYESYGNPYDEESGNPYSQSGNPYGGAGHTTTTTTTTTTNNHSNTQGAATKTDSRLGLQQSDSNYSDQVAAPGQGQGQGQGGAYELGQLNQNDPNRLLNECRSVEQAIDEVLNERKRLEDLQGRYLRDVDAGESAIRREMDRTAENIRSQYAALVQRVRRLKSDPESGAPRNAPQIGRLDRRLKQELNKYQEEGAKFRKQNQDQIARQYLIARPDATPEEVQEAVENPNQQVFAQSLMQADRRGEAQRTMQNVKSRHDAIQKIERDIAEVAQLFQDLNALVVQQEAHVQRIEQQGEQVQENVQKATQELGGAITKAKAARRKKWYCLIICLLIIAIGVGVGCGVGLSNRHN